jgi:hypothetical protein
LHGRSRRAPARAPADSRTSRGGSTTCCGCFGLDADADVREDGDGRDGFDDGAEDGAPDGAGTCWLDAYLYRCDLYSPGLRIDVETRGVPAVHLDAVCLCPLRG